MTQPETENIDTATRSSEFLDALTKLCTHLDALFQLLPLPQEDREELSAACRHELDALQARRETIVQETPPEKSAGFQITESCLGKTRTGLVVVIVVYPNAPAGSVYAWQYTASNGKIITITSGGRCDTRSICRADIVEIYPLPTGITKPCVGRRAGGGELELHATHIPGVLTYQEEGLRVLVYQSGKTMTEISPGKFSHIPGNDIVEIWVPGMNLLQTGVVLPSIATAGISLVELNVTEDELRIPMTVTHEPADNTTAEPLVNIIGPCLGRRRADQKLYVLTANVLTAHKVLPWEYFRLGGDGGAVRALVDSQGRARSTTRRDDILEIYAIPTAIPGQCTGRRRGGAIVELHMVHDATYADFMYSYGGMSIYVSSNGRAHHVANQSETHAAYPSDDIVEIWVPGMDQELPGVKLPELAQPVPVEAVATAAESSAADPFRITGPCEARRRDRAIVTLRDRPGQGHFQFKYVWNGTPVFVAADGRSCSMDNRKGIAINTPDADIVEIWLPGVPKDEAGRQLPELSPPTAMEDTDRAICGLLFSLANVVNNYPELLAGAGWMQETDASKD